MEIYWIGYSPVTIRKIKISIIYFLKFFNYKMFGMKEIASHNLNFKNKERLHFLRRFCSSWTCFGLIASKSWIL